MHGFNTKPIAVEYSYDCMDGYMLFSISFESVDCRRAWSMSLFRTYKRCTSYPSANCRSHHRISLSLFTNRQLCSILANVGKPFVVKIAENTNMTSVNRTRVQTIRRYLVWNAVLCGLFIQVISECGASANTYIIKGSMTNVLFLGSEIISRSCEFVVMASDKDCAFTIETADTTDAKNMKTVEALVRAAVPPGPAGGPVPVAPTNQNEHTLHIWSFDGKNTYTANATHGRWLAFVRPGFVIQHSDSFYELLWLAFAPQCYLPSLTNSFMPPIWSSGAIASAAASYTLPVHFQMISGSSEFLRELVYMNEGLYRGYNGSNVVQIESLTGPYAAGYTNAYYEVTEATNTPVGIYPQRCVFVLFSDIQPGYTGPMRIVRQSEIQLDGLFETNGDIDIRPSFEGRSVLVYDYRISGNVDVAGAARVPYDYVQYSVSNKSWPSPNELIKVGKQKEEQIRVQYAEAKSSVTLANKSHGREMPIRWALWTAICASFVAMIIAVLKSQKHK